MNGPLLSAPTTTRKPRLSTRQYSLPNRERGAALIVALVLMLVLTVLGVSGMNMATLELNMASNAQSQQQAFQAAETGLNLAMASNDFNTAKNTGTTAAIDLGNGASVEQYTVSFQTTTPVPDASFSMGAGSGSIQAFHFDAKATGTGPRKAEALHTQSFYVVGPGGP